MRTVLAGLLAVVAMSAAQAQPAKVYRVGFLSPIQRASTFEAFREGLREHGYVEGKNLVLEARFAEGNMERLPGFIDELLKLKVDVLVCGADRTVQIAKKMTTTVPIVFAGVADPLGPGVVSSLARPDANVTGVTFGFGDGGLGGKWVELLKEAIPGLQHVSVLWTSTDPQSGPLLHAAQAAARRLKIKLSTFDAPDEAALPAALGGIAKSGAGAMFVVNSPVLAARRVEIVRFAEKQRLPAMYFFKLFPDAGGLMSYGGSLEESYRRAAGHVDKILKGAKPYEIPIEQPTRLEFVVNLKAAKAIGLKVPKSLLLRADYVIQ